MGGPWLGPPSFMIEGSPGRVGGVLGLLETFLELPVEQLALLSLRLHLLSKAFFTLGGLRPQRVERGPQILGRAGRRRRLVRDHRFQLGIDGELALTARTRDDKRHGGQATVAPRRRQLARAKPL